MIAIFNRGHTDVSGKQYKAFYAVLLPHGIESLSPLLGRLLLVSVNSTPQRLDLLFVERSLLPDLLQRVQMFSRSKLLDGFRSLQHLFLLIFSSRTQSSSLFVCETSLYLGVVNGG